MSFFRRSAASFAESNRQVPRLVPTLPFQAVSELIHLPLDISQQDVRADSLSHVRVKPLCLLLLSSRF